MGSPSDHYNRSVFNGSDLGKKYSAKTILEKLSAQDRKLDTGKRLSKLLPAERKPGDHFIQVPPPDPLWKALLQSGGAEIASAVSRKKKKRRDGQEQSMNL